MKPKEIRKGFLLLIIALSVVSSEYCSGDKVDTIKYERQKKSQDSIEKTFQENDSHRLTPRVLNHRFQARNTREFDFIRGKVSHRSEFPNVTKTIRNGMRQSIPVIRRREIPDKLKDIPFFRSNEIRRYALRGQRSFRTLDSAIDIPSVQKSRTSQISSKVDTKTPQIEVNTRIIIRKSDKLHLKQNNVMQERNGRFDIRSNRLSHKNLKERTTIFKTNRVRIVNNQNRQEQQNNVRREHTGTVARERLTIRNKSSNRNNIFSKNMERSITKYKPFISNHVDEVVRILNIRSRHDERNRLHNTRFQRTEAINTIRAIQGTETRSTEQRRQDTVPLKARSMSLRRSSATKIPGTNNNIQRRTVRDVLLSPEVSLATRDDPKRALHRNVVKARREYLLNGGHMNRNNGILQENIRKYAPKFTGSQLISKIERSTEQYDRMIAILLLSEITEGRKLRYATYTRSNRLKGISTENRNSKRSVQDRKENRLTIRDTDERKYRFKFDNIGGLSQERVVVQVAKIRDNINNHRFDINRRIEIKKEGDGKSTVLDYGARSQLNIRTNRRYVSRTSDRIISETRKILEINTPESSTRRTIERRSDLSTRRLDDRISATNENKYPDHSRQVKETSDAIQRPFVYSNRRIMLSPERDQRKQREVTEPGKDREVRNFERNTIFRIKDRNREHWSSHYNGERKVISRMRGMYQKLERDLRKHSSLQMRRDINALKLRAEYQQSTRYHERHVRDIRDERIKAVRNRLFQLRSNERLSTEQRTLRNRRLINPGRITRNIPFLKSDERALLNLKRVERMRVTERNGRGFRSKFDILRRYAGNRRIELLKESESFTQVTKNFVNNLLEKIVQDRVQRRERINRGSKSYKLERLSSGREVIRGSTDRASRRIRVNVLNSVRNSEKIAGDEMRQRRNTSATNRRLFREQSRSMERHKIVNVKIQESFISVERSDIKLNDNKQNDSPMIPRNGRGFRGKGRNFVRIETILKYNYNRNNLFLTIYYRKQDAPLHSQILKPVENGIRFIVSRRAFRTFSFDRNTGKERNYERATFENQRNIRNNQRFLLEKKGKFNSNLNGFVDRQTPNRNIHSTHRNYEEGTIPYKSYYNSNRRASDRILSLNQSPTRRYDMRVEKYLENARTGNQKMRNRMFSEETKFDNIRQRITSNRLSADTILPAHGALGFPFTSRDNCYESRLLSSLQIHSFLKDQLNDFEKWNMRTVFSWTAHIILGLSIILAASESNSMKRRSFKQRFFDALSLRTEAF